MSTKNLRTNHQIRSRELRVIDEQNNQLGVLTKEEALRLAIERNLDLVEVSPLAVPPVARILDYGAFRYQQAKAERKQKAHQKKIELKSIRLHLNTGTGDLERKARETEDFLKEGHKVKIEMVLRGREKGKRDFGREKIDLFMNMLTVPLTIEQGFSSVGNRLSTVIGLTHAKAKNA